MSSSHPFRFGAICIGPQTAQSLAEFARRLEGEGFDTLLVADHYTPDPMSCGPMLVAAANATTTLRVGSYVYNNDFRHPALLAKEAAIIDVLSGGRLELGVGAGYRAGEYDVVGLAFDAPSVRAGRFEEAVEIITRLLRAETVDCKGRYYRLSAYPGIPMPLQRPVPLLIARRWPAHAAPRRAHGRHRWIRPAIAAWRRRERQRVCTHDAGCPGGGA